MEGLFTSPYVSNLPNTKPLFKPSLPASSPSSCWLCNSPAKPHTNLRLRTGTNHELRLHALLHNEAPSEGEDNFPKSNGFGFFREDIFSLSEDNLGTNRSGEVANSIIDVETALALSQGAGNSGGNRAGLFRTPISGGVSNATSAHGLPHPALAVRNLLEQARYAHLCTVMSQMHHRREGYPFGSLVDFAPDQSGHPIFLFSPLAIHSRNLLAEPRCSLVVQIPGWSGLSNARVTLFGDVYPLEENEQEWAHKQYLAKHQHGPSEQLGNFHYFRMNNISDIYFIGGFGTVDWVNVKEYETIKPDKIAVDGGEQNLKELNSIFSKPLRELLSEEAEIDDAALISIDSKGIDIRLRQGAQFSIQRLAFEEDRGVETMEEAKSALWKVIERVKMEYLQK